MKDHMPSIFNDVIGPVMRGASSSHVAGAARIGTMLREAAGGNIRKVTVDFDVNGSLAESHDGHGTDMGFACGILGIPLTDPRVKDYESLIDESGIDLQYRILDYGAEHPNYYRISASTEAGSSISMGAVSTGGGMIEIVNIDGYGVSIGGGYYESLFEEVHNIPDGIETILRKYISSFEKITAGTYADRYFILLSTSRRLTEDEKNFIVSLTDSKRVREISPVLPTHSSAEEKVPFHTAEEMMNFNKNRNLPMWRLAALYESMRGSITEEEVISKMTEIVDLMEKSVEAGLEKSYYQDRILQSQAYLMKESSRQIPGDVMNRTIEYITAIMEAKSSMNVITAAPTAGSCGCLPGTLLAMEKSMGFTREDTVHGMLAAGLVGVFFAHEATFAAEVGGCQVECGAGSGMAAAGAAQMMGATAEECADSASMALQGLTGLACDPVANRVEVPCLNKNIVGGMNALACANMILAGYDKVIPLDETIKAIYDIGAKLPLELRCTFGGLGKADTSVKIRKDLEDR